MSESLKLLILALAGLALLRVVISFLRRHSEFDFENKIVLVTGGSRGLGLILARELALQGAYVAICARDRDELKRAREILKEYGANVLGVPCDIRDRNQVDQMINEIYQRFGPIDVLINNAGVIEVGPMEVMVLEDYEEAMSTHYWGPLYTTLAVLPEMRKREQGRIVNIASIGGKLSMPHLLPYNASKFALVGLSEGLRAELKKDHIDVTTVCPGLLRTGSPPNAFFKGDHRKEYAWFSISDSLPFFSMDAEKAATQIIEACKLGKAEVILSLPAQIGTKFQGLFPGLTADILATLNRLLPLAGGIGTERAKGKESFSEASPSWWTSLTDEASRKNNEM